MRWLSSSFFGKHAAIWARGYVSDSQVFTAPQNEVEIVAFYMRWIMYFSIYPLLQFSLLHHRYGEFYTHACSFSYIYGYQIWLRVKIPRSRVRSDGKRSDLYWQLKGVVRHRGENQVIRLRVSQCVTWRDFIDESCSHRECIDNETWRFKGGASKLSVKWMMDI